MGAAALAALSGVGAGAVRRSANASARSCVSVRSSSGAVLRWRARRSTRVIASAARSAGRSAVSVAMPSSSAVIHTPRSCRARRWRISIDSACTRSRRARDETQNRAGGSRSARSRTPVSNASHESASSGREAASCAASMAWRSDTSPSANAAQRRGQRSRRVSACAARERTVCSATRRRTAISATAARSAMSSRSRRTAAAVRPRGSCQMPSSVRSGPTHGSGSATASARTRWIRPYSAAVARCRSRARSSSRSSRSAARETASFGASARADSVPGPSLRSCANPASRSSIRPSSTAHAESAAACSSASAGSGAPPHGSTGVGRSLGGVRTPMLEH